MIILREDFSKFLHEIKQGQLEHLLLIGARVPFDNAEQELAKRTPPLKLVKFDHLFIYPTIYVFGKQRYGAEEDSQGGLWFGKFKHITYFSLNEIQEDFREVRQDIPDARAYFFDKTK